MRSYKSLPAATGKTNKLPLRCTLTILGAPVLLALGLPGGAREYLNFRWHSRGRLALDALTTKTKAAIGLSPRPGLIPGGTKLMQPLSGLSYPKAKALTILLPTPST